MLAGSAQAQRAGARPALDHRQPIFNVPGVVLVLLGSFLAVHVAALGCCRRTTGAWLTDGAGVHPGARAAARRELPGGRIAIVTSFVTHQFVHGDLAHLLINSAWLLAFGSAGRAAHRHACASSLFFLLAGSPARCSISPSTAAR